VESTIWMESDMGQGLYESTRTSTYEAVVQRLFRRRFAGPRSRIVSSGPARGGDSTAESCMDGQHLRRPFNDDPEIQSPAEEKSWAAIL
jgi:hypothetical protein